MGAENAPKIARCHKNTTAEILHFAVLSVILERSEESKGRLCSRMTGGLLHVASANSWRLLWIALTTYSVTTTALAPGLSSPFSPSSSFPAFVAKVQ